jgi:HSP20 family molecular chaperone IbpA
MQNLSSSSSSSEATRIEVNVSEFSRGEISVKLRRDNTLLVHALHLDQFAADNFFRKELVKTFPLPAGADVDKIRSVIRNTGILTIDIPMLRDKDAIRRSHEELLKTIDQPIKQQQQQQKNDYSRSTSHTNVPNFNHQTTRSWPSTVPKRTSSLSDIEYRHYPSNTLSFNIAEFLQSTFHPTFEPNGKKLILKVDTRGYEPDELIVRLLDNNLLVQGKNKSLSTKKNQSKQFSQSIRLPDGIDKYNVTSQVMEDGVLVIDIPLLNSVVYR